jgi:Ran GTPase-activating protein (RanGAP) involved in mRNA processing and transport
MDRTRRARSVGAAAAAAAAGGGRGGAAKSPAKQFRVAELSTASQSSFRATVGGYGSSPARRRTLTQSVGRRAKSPTPAFGSQAARGLGSSSEPRSSSPSSAQRNGRGRPKSPYARASSPATRAEEEAGLLVGTRVLARNPADGGWKKARVTHVVARGKKLAVRFEDFATSEVLSRQDVKPAPASSPLSSLPTTTAGSPAQGGGGGGSYRGSSRSSPGVDSRRASPARARTPSAADARRLIGDALAGAPRVVSLSGVRLGEECVELLGRELPRHTQLASLQLQGSGLGARGGAMLATMLRGGRHGELRELGLGDNQLGAGGLKGVGGAAAAARRQQALAALVEVVGRRTPVQRLELGSNGLGPEASEPLGRAVVSSASLHTLGLSANGLGGGGAWQLADVLVQETALTSLDLSANRLGDSGARAMGTCLRLNRSLRLLYLADNDIRERGGIALADGLAHNRALRELHAPANPLSERAAGALAAVLQSVNSTLRKLQLRHADLRGDGGVAALEAIGRALAGRAGSRAAAAAAGEEGVPPSPRAVLAGGGSLRDWCDAMADHVVGVTVGSGDAAAAAGRSPSLPMPRGTPPLDARGVAAGLLLDELLALLQQPPAQAAAAAQHLGLGALALTPRGTARRQQQQGGARRDAAAMAEGSSGPAAPSPGGGGGGEGGGDPQAKLAYVQQLYEGGLISEEVYRSRCAKLRRLLPGDPRDLSGVWEVRGQTTASGGEVMVEHIELLQLPGGGAGGVGGELVGGHVGDDVPAPERFQIHHGFVRQGRGEGGGAAATVQFVQSYDDEEETIWNATLQGYGQGSQAAITSSGAAAASAPLRMVDGRWTVRGGYGCMPPPLPRAAAAHGQQQPPVPPPLL